MSEEEARLVAMDDAAYWGALVEKGMSREEAMSMVVCRIASRILGDKLKPEKEPWQR